MSMNLTIIGLCCTILGVFFIALSIIVKSPRTIMRELLGVEVDRLKSFKYFIARRLMAGLGFLFALVGCALQIYGVLAEKSDAGSAGNLGAYLIVTILTMVIVGFSLYRFCDVLARWIFVRQFRSFAARHRMPIHRDESLLKELGGGPPSVPRASWASGPSMRMAAAPSRAPSSQGASVSLAPCPFESRRPWPCRRVGT